MATPDSSQLGTLVRMRNLELTEIPSHRELASHQQGASPPTVEAFVASALEESNGFMTSYLPQQFKVKDKNKQAPPSTAPVELSSHEIQAKDLPKKVRDTGISGEAWFARTSIHENEAKKGTASWEEFDGALRVDHSQHEMDYTPDVFDAHEALNWDESLNQVDRRVSDWQDVHASIMEMAHHIPAPLNNRVFTVLVITAKKEKEFITVQIPVTTKGLPNAKYTEAGKITHGMYCSIERGELVEEDKKVKWQMATASDAKGVLPMWAQKMGVPGAVVKDVGLVIDWCQKNRAGRT